MLDINGFISETNDTNIFLVQDSKILTPTTDSCLPGLTRQMILEIAIKEGINTDEKNLSNTDLYSADEVFTSGTMGEITPILEADGRKIGDGQAGSMTKRMQKLHSRYAYENGEPIPFKKPAK